MTNNAGPQIVADADCERRPAGVAGADFPHFRVEGKGLAPPVAEDFEGVKQLAHRR